MNPLQAKGTLSRDTKLAIAGAVLGIAGLLATLATWRFPWSSAPAAEQPKQASEARAETPKQPPTVLPVKTGQVEPPAPVSMTLEFRPIELTLKSGEQRVVLSGLVGLSIEQSTVGEMQILTLRVSPSGGTSKSHAVLGSGARVKFHVGGQAYVVSVLSWDQRARDAVLRVDREN